MAADDVLRGLDVLIADAHQVLEELPKLLEQAAKALAELKEAGYGR